MLEIHVFALILTNVQPKSPFPILVCRVCGQIGLKKSHKIKTRT